MKHSALNRSPIRIFSVVSVLALVAALASPAAFGDRPEERSERINAPTSPAALSTPSVTPGAATPSAGTPGAAAPSEQPAAESVKLDDAEANLGRRYRQFERTLQQMAEYLRKTEPERADLLIRTLSRSKEDRVIQQMDQVIELLKGDQFGDAISRQEQLVGTLKTLLELLQSEDRRHQLEEERKWLESVQKDVAKLSAREKDLRKATEGSGKLGALSERQKEIERDAKLLVEKIDKQDAARKGAEKKPGDKNKPGANGKPQGDGKDPQDRGEGKLSDGSDKEQNPSGQPDPKKDPRKEKDQQSKSQDGSPKKSGAQKKDPKNAGSKKNGSQKKDPQKSDSKSNDPKNDNSQKDDSQKNDPKKDDGSKDEKSESGEPKQSESKDAPSQKSPSQKGKQGQPKYDSEPPPLGEENRPSENSPSDESGDESEQQQKSRKTPGREDIEQARKAMQRAKEELKRLDGKKAVKEQEEAIRKLADARDKLEKILRQLREEEQEIMLASLEARFAKMLIMQIQIHVDTVALSKTAKDAWTARHFGRSRDLSVQEEAIAAEAAKALALLKEEGSSVAFPKGVEQVRDDMLGIARRLGQNDVADLTQSLEKEVIESLEELVAALQAEIENRKKPESQRQRQRQQSGQPEDNSLVEQLAELKMLRSLQLRVNRRTKMVGQLIKGEQAGSEDLTGQLRILARRQAEIQEATYILASGRNR